MDPAAVRAHANRSERAVRATRFLSETRICACARAYDDDGRHIIIFVLKMWWLSLPRIVISTADNRWSWSLPRFLLYYTVVVNRGRSLMTPYRCAEQRIVDQQIRAVRLGNTNIPFFLFCYCVYGERKKPSFCVCVLDLVVRRSCFFS